MYGAVGWPAPASMPADGCGFWFWGEMPLGLPWMQKFYTNSELSKIETIFTVRNFGEFSVVPVFLGEKNVGCIFWHFSSCASFVCELFLLFRLNKDARARTHTHFRSEYLCRRHRGLASYVCRSICTTCFTRCLAMSTPKYHERLTAHLRAESTCLFDPHNNRCAYSHV